MKSLPIIGFSALWVFFEWIRLWIFTGFPWLYIGYAFIDTPLAGYAPIGSVFLVSFMVCVSAECFFYFVKHVRAQLKQKHLSSVSSAALFSAVAGSSKARQLIGIQFAIWALGLASLSLSWSEKLREHTFQVSMVQGNVDQNEKWLPENREWTKAMYRDLANKEWLNESPDIILFPEAAIPQRYGEAVDYFEELAQTAREHSSTLISGALYTDWEVSPPRTYNSVYSFNHEIQMYAKQRLVPFGEYVPMAKELSTIFPFFKELQKVGVSSGSADQKGLEIDGFEFSPSICYEVLYPNLVQKYGRDSAVLFTISNDAWFGTSHGPPQHFQMARMRALELDRYMMRGTNNGITAIINPKGKVVNQLEQHVRDVLRGEIIPAKGRTPFGYWGILPIIGFCSLICAWLLMRKFFKK